MNEWLNSMWQWVVENEDNIVTFFTSTNFVAAVTTAATVIKSIATTKKNTVSINSINDTMKQNQIISSDITDVKSSVDLLHKELADNRLELEAHKQKVTKLQDSVTQYEEECLTKLNAILEVQGIVYATIKDDEVRNTVNSLLVTAKHSDALSKAKLQEEIDKLKQEIAVKNSELEAAVNNIVEKVATEVTATTTKETGKTKKSKITRY